VTSIALAGFIHLAIVPDHLSHAPAHGISFALIGIAQISWVIIFWRFLSVKPLHWSGLAVSEGVVVLCYWAGFALSGGIVILWLLTQIFSPPFATEPEPVDLATLVSKIAEAIGFIALLAYARQLRIGPSSLVAVSKALTLALVFGVVSFGSGHAAAPIFPNLTHRHGNEPHEHTSNDDHAHPSNEDHHSEEVIKELQHEPGFSPTHSHQASKGEHASHNDSGGELDHEDQLLERHTDHTKEVEVNHLGEKDGPIQSQKPTENRVPRMSEVEEVGGQSKSEDVTPDLGRQETDIGSAENAILGGDEVRQGSQLDPVTPAHDEAEHEHPAEQVGGADHNQRDQTLETDHHQHDDGDSHD
jgi:hypothetical protein